MVGDIAKLLVLDDFAAIHRLPWALAKWIDCEFQKVLDDFSDREKVSEKIKLEGPGTDNPESRVGYFRSGSLFGMR